jgi:SAM-dependent methyltransferase
VNFISTFKHCVPRPLRPPLRKCVYRLFPSLRYASQVRMEIDTYTGIENVHDLPAIAHYWSEKYLCPLLEPFGFRNSVEFFRIYIAQVCAKKPQQTVSILSVGAGNCATEINIAEWLRENRIENYTFECLDINPHVLKRAAIAASEKGFSDRFALSTFDINTWKPARSYDVILAIQCLHHFVELELLFEKIHGALDPAGYFLSDDMIGRNGHQRWPEALKFVKEFWRELPDKYRYNHGLKRAEKEFPNWDCASEGFEGIRAQDILPLLTRRFYFDLFVGFGNIVDIFVDRAYGPNFDPASEWDRTFIDRVQAVDQREIESGRVKPTHMVAAMTKQPVSQPRIYKHLSPEFCVRRPNRWGHWRLDAKKPRIARI